MRVELSCLPELAELLPPPVPARRALPDWLRAMPLTQAIEGFGEEPTVKNCPPFIDAMTEGFVIPLATDIAVEDGRFTWDWPHEASPLSFHFATQVAGSPLDADGRSVIKFTNFWTIRTEPGWSVLFTHPVNRPELPFRTLTGLVDTDAFHALPVHFPARWLDPAFTGVLAKGTPVAQGFLIRRENLELSVGVQSDAEREASDRLRAELRADRNLYRNRLRQPRPSIDVSQ